MTNVVILEDNISIASMLCVLAKRSNLEYIHFTTPSQAIAGGVIEKADFIISDFEMPPENAFVLLKYLRDNNLKIPVIMHSAYDDIRNVIMKQGYTDLIDEYLDKPSDIKTILNTMKKFINKCKRRQ